MLLQHHIGITFSNYTYATLGAEAMTLELGKANPFGMNAQVDLQALEAVLRVLLEARRLPDAPQSRMQCFNVSYEVIKHKQSLRTVFGRSGQELYITAGRDVACRRRRAVLGD